MNKVAKSHVDHQRSTWVQVTNNMFDLVNDQLQEIEKAVHGMGEYRFKSQYKHLELDSSKWFMMSPEQRQKHLNKVFQQSCIPYRHDQQSTSTSKEASEVLGKTSNNPSSSVQSLSVKQHLSVPVQQCGITKLSADMLTCMWEKAERILNTHGNICNTPGMPDSFCVASEGGGKPHIVTRNKKGVIVCDEACLGWKSQKMCSHVLATTEKMGCLNESIQAYRRLKQPISYTAALTHGLSKSVGKNQVLHRSAKVHQMYLSLKSTCM